MRKHILCFGDSNTHGYCADPTDCADGGMRFNEDERWTCLLQEKLGKDYLVTEEGLNGRTTVFPDPLTEGLDGIASLTPILKSHEVLDLLVIMLGTNDTKERFSMSPYSITKGMERLVRKAKSIECWGGKTPNILIVSPPPICDKLGQGPLAEEMGEGAWQKSQELAPRYEALAELLGVHFMDAAGCEFNQVDYMHFTRAGHVQMAERMAEQVHKLVD